MWALLLSISRYDFFLGGKLPLKHAWINLSHIWGLHFLIQLALCLQKGAPGRAGTCMWWPVGKGCAWYFIDCMWKGSWPYSQTPGDSQSGEKAKGEHSWEKGRQNGYLPIYSVHSYKHTNEMSRLLPGYDLCLMVEFEGQAPFFFSCSSK